MGRSTTRGRQPALCRLLLIGGLLALALAGCGAGAPAGPTLAPILHGLSVRPHARALRSGLVYTSPDGGFYRDPTYLRVYATRLVPLRAVLPLLPASDRSASRRLAGLGPLYAVVARADNPGAATADISLATAVLESVLTRRLVPAGVHGSIARTFYQPIRPIVVLSNQRLDLCSVAVPPGGQTWLVAVFPPVDVRVGVALVVPANFGFYLPTDAGALPAPIPGTLFAGDVNTCLQQSAAG